MSDAILDIEGIEESGPVVVAGIEPRPYLAHHLPDRTPLVLTAGIVMDLAAMFQDDFLTYVPQRADEFSFLLFMASRPASERGSVWRDGSPPLMSDFPRFRSTVSRWVDDTFRASEADYVRRLAIDLWLHHTGTKASVHEPQKKTETDHLSTPRTEPANAFISSPVETSSQETAQNGG